MPKKVLTGMFLITFVIILVVISTVQHLKSIHLNSQVMAQELVDLQLELQGLRASTGIETQYLGVFHSLIGKLQEYHQFDSYTPEQISNTALTVIEQSALYHDAGITPALVLAVMEQESGFDPFAVSSAQAVGLMQVRRAAAQTTLERLGYTYSIALMQDPVLNTKVGIEYLVWLHKLFMSEGVEASGEFTYTLMAYNNGPTAAWSFIAGDDIVVNGEYAASVQRLKSRYLETGLE